MRPFASSRLTVTLVASLSLLAVGCSRENTRKVSFVTTPVIEDVSVTIDPKGTTEQGVRVLVRVQLSNPNDVALPLSRAVYTVAIDGAGEARFEDQPNRTLPRLGAQVVTLPAALAWSGGDVTGRRFRVHGSISYEPPGEIRTFMTESGVPLPSVSFASEGAF